MRKLTDNGQGATSGVVPAPRPDSDRQGLGLDVFDAWVSALADGILILRSDGRIVYANRAYCELIGCPLDRVLGQDALALVPERLRQTVLKH